MILLFLAMGFLVCWALVLYLGFSETAEWLVPVFFVLGVTCAVAFVWVVGTAII